MAMATERIMDGLVVKFLKEERILSERYESCSGVVGVMSDSEYLGTNRTVSPSYIADVIHPWNPMHIVQTVRISLCTPPRCLYLAAISRVVFFGPFRTWLNYLHRVSAKHSEQIIRLGGLRISLKAHTSRHVKAETLPN